MLASTFALFGLSEDAIILIVLAWLLTSAFVAVLARDRGFSTSGFFLLALLVSPIIGLIAVLIMGESRLGPAATAPDHIDQLAKLNELVTPAGLRQTNSARRRRGYSVNGRPERSGSVVCASAGAGPCASRRGQSDTR